jgi:hypothetical protein
LADHSILKIIHSFLGRAIRDWEREERMIAMLMLLAEMTSFSTGQDLAAMCKKDRPACLKYIQGGSDMATGLQANRAMASMICVPPSASGNDLINDVSAFLAAHPEALDQSAGGLLWAALYDAFPCPSDGR